MKLFDSHCHLDDQTFDADIDAVIQRMQAAGVAAAMIVGTTQERSIRAVSIAESYPGCYASVGIHPHDAKEGSEETLKFLVNLAKNPKVRAWGEIGLDFNRMFSPRKDQEMWLVRQLEIAAELDLAVIFHERDSSGRLIEILKTCHKTFHAGVIHCFSGEKSELKQYLDLGLYIGITGIVTIKNRGAELRKLAPLIPADRILVETDAPYLTPVPEKNHTRRNEPAFVRSVLLKLAEVRREDPEHFSAQVWKNTCRLFNIQVDQRIQALL
ncbi:MAG: TatD family hydrolase [Pseudomonadota bacterium]|nr:TatD family hydrolase [Pseudomonadota bacterium]